MCKPKKPKVKEPPRPPAPPDPELAAPTRLSIRREASTRSGVRSLVVKRSRA